MDKKADQRVLVDLLRRSCTDGADRKGWDAADFLHEYGSARAALVHAALFMPRFIKIEGEVFFEDLGVRPQGGLDDWAERVRQLKAQSPEALALFVNSCNWLELPYLFRGSSGTEQAYRLLAHLLAEAWSTRLRSLFPDRTFRVRVIEAEETGSVTGIGFEKST